MNGDVREREHDPIRVGVSWCLLGERCRWNGDHKRDGFVTDTLGKFVEFVPSCPEREIGLGVPRETLRLAKVDGNVRMVTSRGGTDHTDTMLEYSRKKVEEYGGLDICGYILKKDSPTCGMERVKLYDANGVPSRMGIGIYAQVLLERFPLLPVEEEGRLHDPQLRENFFVRVFAFRRMRTLLESQWTIGDLVRFHTSEKFLLMAHSPSHYQELGRLVANAKGMDRSELEEQYRTLYMTALKRKASKGRNTHVLQHMEGYLREHLGDRAREELARVLADYSAGLIPLVVPVTLLAHYARVHDVEYLRGQYYLEPSPGELMLRNYT